MRSVLSIIVHLLLLARGCPSLNTSGGKVEEVEDMEVPLSVVGGIACPYSATWMADIQLFMKARFYLTEPKMEQASFSIFRKVQKLYQVTHLEDFHILHMSAYEHGVSKLEGFEKAEIKTNLFAEHTLRQECSLTKISNNSMGNQPHPSLNSTSFGFVPFYSKLPAGTVLNKDTKTAKVTSIGQGNSLVNPVIKVKQLLATLCSILQHFEYVIVGVTAETERELISATLDAFLPPPLAAAVMSRLAVKVFQLRVPALLPFYLLHWGQFVLAQHNCGLQQQSSVYTLHPYCQNNMWDLDITATTTYINKQSHKHSCCKSQDKKWSLPLLLDGRSLVQILLTGEQEVSIVYYSESDSILRPRNRRVMEGLLKVLNSDTIVTPIRVQKDPKSGPVPLPASLSSTSLLSMQGSSTTSDLMLTRSPCGKPLCTLHLPYRAQSHLLLQSLQLSQRLPPSYHSSVLSSTPKPNISCAKDVSTEVIRNSKSTSSYNDNNDNKKSRHSNRGRGFGNSKNSFSEEEEEPLHATGVYSSSGTKKKVRSRSRLPPRGPSQGMKRQYWNKLRTEAAAAIQKAIL